MENQVQTQVTVPESEFTGSLGAMIGINILTWLVSIITIGLAFPAMYCWKQRWLKHNTFIDGKQLVFDGKGIQLFGSWLKWILLSLITIGIFALWLPIKMEQWRSKHTHFATVYTEINGN